MRQRRTAVEVPGGAEFREPGSSSDKPFDASMSHLFQPPPPAARRQLAFVPEGKPERIAETLVAFANGEGGTLVLGVDADGRPGDLYTEEEASDALRAAERLCRPPVRTSDWRQEPVSGGIVVVVRVDRSSELHTLADGRVLVRRGAENVPVEGPEIERLLASRTGGDFELEPVAGARARIWTRTWSPTTSSAGSSAIPATPSCPRTACCSRSAP